MDSLMNATTHSTTTRTKPTRPDRELPAREHYPARASTIRHRLERAHNPKVGGSAAGPRRVGENPPLQRVGRFVGKAAAPVLNICCDLGVCNWFGSAHLPGSMVRGTGVARVSLTWCQRRGLLWRTRMLIQVVMYPPQASIVSRRRARRSDLA